jgi:hypothetical protein
MSVELLERIVLEDIQEGRLPPYWDDKEVIQGLYKSVTAVFQTFVDLVKTEVEGTTISNAVGRNLDDIGYMFNEDRDGRNDNDYRAAILNKMAAFSDSGTTSDVLRYVDSTLNTTYSDLTPYPDTRFGTISVEGAVVTIQAARNIGQKVSSGAAVEVFWDEGDASFVPCCLVSLAEVDNLQASTDTGNQDIEIQLDAGLIDTLGYTTEESLVIYPRGIERSILGIELQSSAVLTDTLDDPILVMTTTGWDTLELLLDEFPGGRYLVSTAVSSSPL